MARAKDSVPAVRSRAATSPVVTEVGNSGAPAEEIESLQRSAGNAAVLRLLQEPRMRAAPPRARAVLQRLGGWGDTAVKENQGDSDVPVATGGLAFRRIPVTGISGASTDRAIVYVPAGAPPANLDILLYLHGHPSSGPGGYEGGKKDQKTSSDPGHAPDDIDEYRIGAQLSAAGRPMAAMLPQGIGKSDFAAGKARAFHADDYIKSALVRLDALGTWPGAKPPSPGRVLLAGHSGADTPMDRMLHTGLGPKKLGALFLFDTMYPDGRNLKGRFWTAIERRLEADLAQLAALRQNAADPTAATKAMLDFVVDQGFRVYGVHANGRYKKAMDHLVAEFGQWLKARRVSAVLGPPGSLVSDAVSANFKVGSGAGGHMGILSKDDHLAEAIRLLGRPGSGAPSATPVPAGTAPTKPTTSPTKPASTKPAPTPAKATPVGPATAPSPTPATKGAATPPPTKEQIAEVVDQATQRVHTAVRGVAAPFVGASEAADIPGVLSLQIISAKKDPRKRLKAGNRLVPLYDVLWSPEVLADLKSIDNPTGAKRSKRNDEARRTLYSNLLASLLTNVAAGAPVQAPDKPSDRAGQMAAEKALLSDALADLVDDRWATVRTGVIVEFGGLVDGTRTAIERANAYFGQLKKAKFLEYQGYTVVHPELQEALSRAETWLGPQLKKLKPEEAASIHANVGKMWSAIVRPNQNAKHRLSPHSWGWAIDIAAAYNPNIGKQSGLDAVELVTGKNPRAASTKGLGADAVLEVAKDLLNTSRSYQDIMSSKDKLSPVALRMANQARIDAKLTPLPATAGAAIVDVLLLKKGKDRTKGLRAATWPEGTDGKDKAPQAILAVEKQLGVIGNAFRTSFTSKGRAAPRTEGSAGSVAAHGFLNLPPLLVAALTGKDSGGLTWLGTHNQDYMHFQLAKQPPRY